jgi:phosphoesterase RecJ-like protein
MQEPEHHDGGIVVPFVRKGCGILRSSRISRAYNPRWVPSAEQAPLMLFGLATDTGFFRHIRASSGETLRVSASLVDLGTSLAEVFAMLFGGRTFDNRRLLARMIDRVETYVGGRLLFTWLTLDDKRAVKHTKRSSHGRRR